MVFKVKVSVGNDISLLSNCNRTFKNATITDIKNTKSTSKTFGVKSNFIFPLSIFNKTTIYFTIEEKGKVQLQVFDLNGQLVHTITNKKLQTGNYKFKWNGTDKNGKEVKTGVYIVTLKIIGKTLKQIKIVKR